MRAPARASSAKAASHSEPAVIVMVTCTPRRAAAARAAVTAGSSISSPSTARVCFASSMTDRTDASAPLGNLPTSDQM